MGNIQLPCEQMRAELGRLCRKYGRDLADADMGVEWHDGLLHFVATFPDGTTRGVPLDQEAQDMIRAGLATKH